MRTHSSFSGSDVRRSNAKLRTKARKRRRQMALESLESRVVLSYTFTYNPTSQVATVQGTTATDSLVIEPVSGFLEWSVNGSAFSGVWQNATPPPTTVSVPAAPTVTVDIYLSTGNGSTLQLGTATGPASKLLASFDVYGVAGTTTDTSTIDDATGTTLATGLNAYTINTGQSPYEITGPGFSYFEPHGWFSGGVTLMGSAVNGNVYNVLSNLNPAVYGTEPINVVTAAGTTSTVNVGSGGTVSLIRSPLAIYDPGDGTTVNINDAGDTTNATATLDNQSGNINAPYEVTGLSPAPIEYGPGVTALNIYGGTSGSSTGVTYNINNTQAGTTTTINGGPHKNTYVLSKVNEAGGLDNLPGPVVINGGGADDFVNVFDTDNSADVTYTLTAMTLITNSVFGGLTYGGLGAGSFDLHGSHGNDVFDVNSTANGVTTMIYGVSGADTVNVYGTGTGGTLSVYSGDYTSVPSTVNVLADSQPVYIYSEAPTTVNIGSTGGAGSMAGIQGPISVGTMSAYPTSLNFHDENDTGSPTWTLNNDDHHHTGSVAFSGSATTTYDPSDLASLTIYGGSGGNTFYVNDTSSDFPTTLYTGTGDDSTYVYATGDNTLDIYGQDGIDTVDLGGSTSFPAGMQGLNGTIYVANADGLTNLVLDDSEDTRGQDALLYNDGTNGQVTGLSPATINYSDGDGGVASLTVYGGSGRNTFTVDGTLNNPGYIPAPTDLYTGTGRDRTFVQATNANGPLNIYGEGGQDLVVVSDDGSLTGILGPVYVENDGGYTDLVVDSSADQLDSYDFYLLSSLDTSTLTNTNPNGPPLGAITYVTADLSSLTINTNDYNFQTLTIDMSGGNPIPSVDTPGLVFNGGADSNSYYYSHTLNIIGELPTGPFETETYNAEDPNVGGAPFYGSIYFNDGQGSPSSLTSLFYTGLQPVTDVTPVYDYTFNDYGYPDQSFQAVDGPVAFGYQTLEFDSTPTNFGPPNFESTDIANKFAVTFNTPPAIPVIPNNGVTGYVNVPTSPDGIYFLYFSTPTGGDNTVTFAALPPNLYYTELTGGAGPDVTNVEGAGLPEFTELALDGGGSSGNVLNLDAGGATPIVTPGYDPSEVFIFLPDDVFIDAINYQQINITDVAPLVITPGPSVTLNTVEGFQNVNSIVGTFSVSIPDIFQPMPPPEGGSEPSDPPPGPPASDFTASIDWGDPTPDPDAGTITQDASNPSIYYITGTHTFAENGTYTVANTVYFAGTPYTQGVNGVPVTVFFDSVGPVAGNDATVNVIQAPLVVSVFPIVGTEDTLIPAGPIATFIDNGGPATGSYSATIQVYDSAGDPVFTTPLTGTVNQNGNAAQYTVDAPSFTLPEEGTYQVVVSVTDSAGATPITVEGASTAVIADAALTANTPLSNTGNTGVPLTTTLVGSFNDANLGATNGDFTGTIYWGDGTPATAATFQRTTPGYFNVFGSHTYAKPGTYTVIAYVHDVGGSVTEVTATYTITDKPVTGSTENFTAVEGQNTGQFVLATFEDPNTLATVADVNATLAKFGWGDGTPPVAGIGLTVQQIGVDPSNGEPIFDVLGSHTYAEETAPGMPDTLSVIITTLGGATTTLTSPSGGGVTVLDAPLTGSTGNEITGTEGLGLGVPPSTTTPVVLGTFTDKNQGATSADFSGVINWGDGSPPLPLTSSNFSSIGTPDGVTWVITAAHTYTEEGTYAYTITVNDVGGSATLVSGSAIVADASLSAGTSVPLTASTGISFSGEVADFTDANTLGSPADFTAIIDWGDGSPNSLGTIVGSDGMYTVDGTHTYARYGDYTTTVIVKDDGGSTVTLTGSATVHDPAIMGVGHSFTSVEGQSSGSVLLATITDPNTLATAPDITAILTTWGDGPTGLSVPLSVVQVSSTPTDTVFDIYGSHIYKEEGSYTFSLDVTTLDPANPAITVTGTATVTDAPLTGSSGTELTGTEGLGLGVPPSTTTPVVVGTFTDANPFAPITDFTVSINWGDGSMASAGVVTQPGGPGTVFEVSGSHTYLEEGTYAVTATVTDDGGSFTVITASAIIADAALTPGSPKELTANTGITLPSSTVVATFTDANTFATTADYTATIDWGDGLPQSTGVVVATTTAGVFDVEGTHTYARPNSAAVPSYTTLVTVHDDGGSQVVIPGSATVTDPQITGTGNPITSTEYASTGTVVLATIDNPNLLATNASVSAVLTTWGDGTPTSPVPVSITLVGGTSTETIFQITGSHVYTEEGTYTFSITVDTSGYTTTSETNYGTTLTVTGTATVLDAPLSSSNGAEITGVEGTATPVTTVLGTFTDANQDATVADYTTGNGSVVVNWGDGSAPQTLGPGNLTSSGGPNGIIWTIKASHDYVEEGTYQYSVTVTDDGGATTTFIGSAIIADAPLSPTEIQPIVSQDEPTIFPIPVFSPQLINAAPIAEFTDANPLPVVPPTNPPTGGSSSVADFTATIDWGDGTAIVPGTVVLVPTTPPSATYEVLGSHTYADAGVNGGSGTYNIQVFVVDDGGSKLTIDNTATVTDNPLSVTGNINPKSVSGLSTGTPDVTNVNQPDFFGTVLATLPSETTTPEAYAEVTLTATNTTTGIATTLGTVQAGSGGAWNLKSQVVLADGHYAITATATDQFGVTVSSSPSTLVSDLLIDTTGPKIDGMFFNRLNGQVDYIIKDPVNPDGSAPSGVWVNTLLDSSNYLLTKVHANKAYPGKWIVTNVTATPDPTIPFAYDVAVTFNSGNIIQGGFYLFTIRDSSDGNSSVQDLAENHLDGEFFGSFPSGNGINGSDFVAELQAYHNKVFAPQTILGTAFAGNGGDGGPPVAPVHSGIWVPLLPRGASPIFSTSTSPSNGADPPASHKKVKTHIVVKTKQGQSLLSTSNDKAKPKIVTSTNHPKGPKSK